MRNIITKKVYFTSLDKNFNPCSERAASYQLEEYQTNNETAHAINSYTGKFSYKLGQKVDVIPNMRLNSGIVLEKVIKNECINSIYNNRVL